MHQKQPPARIAVSCLGKASDVAGARENTHINVAGILKKRSFNVFFMVNDVSNECC